MPKRAIELGPTAHVDTFTRDHLPPAAQWPDLLLDRAEFQYPEHLNAAGELTDRMVDKGFGDHVALIGNGRRRTYKELADWTNRLAEPADVSASAIAWAAELAAGPTFGHAMTKRMLHHEWAMSVDQAIEAEAQAQAICMMTDDFKRAYEAFQAKRAPHFSGE